MGAQPLPIASYRLPAPVASSARLVNVYAEKAPAGSSKQPVLLRRAPGIRAHWTLGDGVGPVRGFAFMQDELYVLSGSTVYRVNNAGTATALTGSVPGSERVRMSTNGINVAIVRPTDNTLYTCDSSAVTQNLDPIFTAWGARDVDFLDGYFVFRRPNSHQIFNTQLNSLTFNALNIASVEGAPDNLNGLIVDHRELFLPGVSSCEVWYDAANAVGSPFSRSPNGLLEIGCAAEYSPAKADNAVFWLADDLTARRLNGINPEKVSQPGVESVIQRMAQTSDAFGMGYTLDGHIFYVLQFPNAGRTFVYDATTDQWHERESLGYGAWRANCITRAFGKVLVGDSQTGRVGVLDPDLFTEWGEPQRASWAYQSVYGGGAFVSHHRLELVLNAGAGLVSGQGSNPLATLYVSNDSGNTFAAMPTRELGRRGHYEHRTVWWRLGSSRDRVYRVDITDPVPLFAVDTQLDATGGR